VSRKIALQEGEMSIRRLLIVPLFAGVLLTTIAVSFSAAVKAQDKEQTPTTDSTKTTTTPTGFPTGTKCTKTGTYTAENKFLKVVIVVAEGEEFPLFADGEKTIWYALVPSTKSTLDAVKVTTSDPK
jgi:hypothetical protein